MKSPQPRGVNSTEKLLAAAMVVSLAALGVTGASAQASSTQAPSPRFDVASVKPSAGAGGQVGRESGWGDVTGRVNLLDVHLADVLLRAYGLQPYQLSGPEWLDTDFFDILAVVPVGAPKQQIPSMFQALLDERFKLNFHRETQMAPAYALVVAAGGSKLKETMPDDAYVPRTEAYTSSGGKLSHTAEGSGPFGLAKTSFANGTLHTEFASMTMKALTEYLNQYPNNRNLIGIVDLPVVDMTGLKGSYQVTLDISRNDMPRARGAVPENQGEPGEALPTASEPSGNSVRQSLAKLGLGLERRRLPIERFVVDHIERTPTEN